MSGTLRSFIRNQSDDFEFGSKDYRVRSSHMEEDFISDDDDDEVPEWSITDSTKPEYIRRFEDDYPVDMMVKFLKHQLSNIRNNRKNGKREYDKNNRIMQLFESNSGDSGRQWVLESETLTVNRDINPEEEMSKQEAIERLPYLLSRLDGAGRTCGVNMISYAFAVILSSEETSKITYKPGSLVNTGKLYRYSDSDQFIKISHVDYSVLQEARNLVVYDGEYSYKREFNEFLQVLYVLGIDVAADDAANYPYSMIRRIKWNQYRDNVERASRGSVHMKLEVIKALKRLSLDSLKQSVPEIEQDTIGLIMDVLCSAPPSNEVAEMILKGGSAIDRRDFMRNYGGDLFWAVSNCDIVVSHFDSSFLHKFDEDGFARGTEEGDPMMLEVPKLIPNGRSAETTGNIFIHCTGYAFFEPKVTYQVLCVHIMDLIDALNTYKRTGDISAAKECMNVITVAKQVAYEDS